MLGGFRHRLYRRGRRPLQCDHSAWGGNGRRSFAVNLLDAEESDTEPRPVLRLGKEQVTPGPDTSQPRELWKWFAGLGVIVLLLEWYVYNRRVHV